MHMPVRSEGPERLWTPALGALLAAQAFFGYAFSSFFLIPTWLSRELGGSATDVGWVMSAGSAAVVVLLPVMGHATDRLGRTRFLVLGGALMGVASLGFAFVDAIGPLLYALRIAQAVAFSMTFAAGGALAVDLAPPARVGQAVGLFGLTFLAMNGVASAVVEQLAEGVGWPMAFGAAGAAALVSAALSALLREGRSAAPPGVTPARVPDGESPPRVSWTALWIMASVGLALGAMFNFAQLYAAALGLTDVSRFFVTYALTGVFVRAGFGHWFDTWGVRRTSTVALALYVLVLVATMRLDGFGLVSIGCGLGLAHGAFYPSFTAVSLQAVGASGRGRVIAYVQAAFSVGATASAGLGVIADTLGYATVFGIAAAGLAVAWLLLVRLPSESRYGAQPG